MKTEIKLFVTTMLTGLALVLGVLAYQYYDLEHYQKRRLLDGKSFFSKTISDLTIREFMAADQAGFERLCGALYRRHEMVYLAMIAPDNKEVLYLCTDRDRTAILAERGRFAKGGVQGEVKIIGIPAVPVRTWVFSPGGKKIGAIEAAYSWLPLYDQFKRRAKTFLVFFLVLSAVLGAVLVFRARALLGPLARFASNLKSIEAEWPVPQEEFQARLETDKAGPEIKPVLDVLKVSLVKLLEHQEALRKSEELASLGNLAAQVAHDIRSPLAALGATAKSLEMPEDQRKLVEGAVSRMQGIADDLLQRYRAPSVGPAKATVSVCALGGLIEQILAEKRLQHKDKTGVEIEFNNSAEDVKALTDPKELQRLLSNLVNNAVEAFIGPGMVSVGLAAFDDKVLIEVKDNGKGIPPEILAKLGKKGETHGKAGGNGLGLYHARTTIEGWGGNFKIESEQGKGTSVSIALPRAAAPAGKMAILLDDDMLVHMNWKLAAKAAGVELKAFKTPEELSAGAENLPKDTPVYIDSDLGNNIKGEDIAIELRDKGFTDLTMATGHGPEKFAHLPWLKVTGKEPPWA